MLKDAQLNIPDVSQRFRFLMHQINLLALVVISFCFEESGISVLMDSSAQLKSRFELAGAKHFDLQCLSIYFSKSSLKRKLNTELIIQLFYFCVYSFT